MFKETLRKLILENFENLSSFAEKSGLSSGHLSDILSGRRNCKAENLDKMIKVLKEKVDKNSIDELEKYWCFSKTEGKLEEKYNSLEKENKNMKEVLAKLKSDKEMLEQLEEMKSYEEFYKNIFEGLTPEESRQVIQDITERLKLISLEKGTFEETKKYFDNITNILNKEDE